MTGEVRRGAPLVAGALVAAGVLLGSALALTRTARPAAGDATTLGTTTVPRAANPLVALVQPYDGSYRGTWTNTSSRTHGRLALVLRIDPEAAVLHASAAFDGDLFGRDEPRRRRLASRVDLSNPNASPAQHSASFGPVTGRLLLDFSVSLDAPDVPDPSVRRFTLTGRLRSDRSGFDGSFVVTHDDGTISVGAVTVGCAPGGQRRAAVETICSP